MATEEAEKKEKSLLLIHVKHLCQISKLVRFDSYSEADNLVKVVWDGEGGEHHFLGDPEKVYTFISGVLVGRQIYTDRKSIFKFAHH